MMFRHGLRAVKMAWAAHPGAVVGAVLVALAFGLSPVAGALLLRAIIDAIGTGSPIGQVAVLGGLLAALGLLTVVGPFITDYLSSQMRRRLQARATQDLYTAIDSWPGLSRFEDPSSYDRVRLGQRAGESAPHTLVNSGVVGVQSAVSVLGFLVAVASINPVLALLVLVSSLPAIPINLMLSRDFAAMTWDTSPAERRAQSLSALLWGLSAAKEVRLFGTGRFLLARLLEEMARVHDAERATEVRSLRRNLSLAVLGGVVSALAIGWAVVQAAEGRFSVGDLAALVVALGGIQSAFGASVLQFAQIHRFLLTFSHYVEVVEYPPDLPLAAEPQSLVTLDEGLRFDQVWFRYDESLPWALRGVSFTLRAGESTGIVGLNGAGKSTIVKLLCRFYDPQRGRILWDGVDLRDIDPLDLRDRMTTVFQDFVSYELTAAENIALGDLTALEDEGRLTDAARAAGVDGLIDNLPHGRDTLLSRALALDPDPLDPQVGTTLSGGEWQRFAIARAAVRSGRDLMILDEPTSGLDPQAEHDIVSELKRQREDATSLVISHRLGTIRGLDQILVIEDGIVVEEGDHDALMAGKGVYAGLFALQASDYQDSNE